MSFKRPLSCVPEVKNITKNKDCYVVCGINNKQCFVQIAQIIMKRYYSAMSVSMQSLYSATKDTYRLKVIAGKEGMN